MKQILNQLMIYISFTNNIFYYLNLKKKIINNYCEVTDTICICCHTCLLNK